MGFILHVMQNISMFRHSWGPSQATLDPSASSHLILIGLQKRLLGCYRRVVAHVPVTLGLPFVSVKLTGPLALSASLRDVSKGINFQLKKKKKGVMNKLFYPQIHNTLITPLGVVVNSIGDENNFVAKRDHQRRKIIVTKNIHTKQVFHFIVIATKS